MKQLLNKNISRRAIRFGITGVFITFVHMAIAIFFIKSFAISPTISNGLAFIGATFISYLINTTWSFSNRLKGKTLLKYFLVSLIGLFSAMIIASVVHELGLHYLIGIILISFLIPPLNFLLHNFWTYSRL